MASLDDVVSTAKNIVTALNSVTAAISNFYGKFATNNVTADAMIKSGSGRLIAVNVTTAGAAGSVHDASSIQNADATNLIGVTPAAVGVVTFNWPFVAGLVYKVGSGQIVNISYS